MRVKLWLRQLAMDWLVALIGWGWEKSWRPRAQAVHAALLQAQLADRRHAGVAETKTGIYEMTDEELQEYGRRF